MALQLNYNMKHSVSTLLLGIFIGSILEFALSCTTTKTTAQEYQKVINQQKTQIAKYKVYVKETETLLDSLESYFNWVDRVDPVGYYEAVKSIKNESKTN